MSNIAAGTFLQFANAGVNAGLAQSPLLSVNVGGGNAWHDMVMDTGSTGIVISEGLVGPQCTRIEPQPDILPPGYSSSSRNNYDGYWAMADVQIRGGGESVATAGQIRIYVVTNFNTTSMMGVGVRWADQSNNPFLNLSGTFRPGYVVSLDGVRFGHGDPAGEGFTTYPFQFQGGPQPQEPQAAVSLLPPADSGLAPFETTVPLLIDTGIDYMIVTPPAAGPQPDHETWEQPVNSPKPGEQCAINPGTQVQVTLGMDSGAATTLYEFNTAECAVFHPQPVPGVPFLVRFAVPQPGSPGIINTGRHLLSRYDYLIDLQDSVIGLRPRTG